VPISTLLAAHIARQALPLRPAVAGVVAPAFWLLVPGAAGLIGVTAIVGTSSRLALNDFTATMVTVLAIALGVLIGTATGRAGFEVRSRAISVGSTAGLIDRH